MNLNIGQKLRTGFSILLILMGVISISSYIALVDMRSATDLLLSRVSVLASMNRLQQKMEEALSSNAFAIAGDVEEKVTFDLKIKSMEDIFNAMVQYDLGVKGPLLNTVRIQYRDIQKKSNLLYKIAEEEGKGFDDSRVEELVEQIEDTQISMLEKMQALVIFFESRIDLAISQADETKDHGIFVTGGLSIVAIIFSMIAAILLTKDITKPVRLLVAATRQVTEGNLEARIESLRNDEIGELNQSFNKMTDTLKNTLVSRDYVDNIIQSMNDSLIVLGRDLVIQRVNRASCRLLGYRKDDLVGCSIWDVLLKEGDSSKDSDFIDMLEKGKFQNREERYVTKEGAGIPVLFSASVMGNKSDLFNNIVCVALNITERKRAEEKLKTFSEKLQKRNRELEDFAHISSHDLQEPLRKLVVFGERLNSKYQTVLEGQGKHYLDRMVSAAKRMQTLINDLLSYNLLSKRAQVFVPIDLTNVAHDVGSEMEEKIGVKKGTIKIGDLPTINADPLQMRYLFQHLIGNAIKFNQEGKALAIKIDSEILRSQEIGSQNIEYMKLTVEDQGIGFDERYIDKIFTVFQRLHERSEYEGNGMGLAICQKIVEHHGGSIEAKSQPGEGAVFIVLLPMYQTQEVEND